MSVPRLLLVEDDASIRRFVSMALEDEALEIVQAADLAQARAALQGPPLSVVMCDLTLPDGSGLDLLLELAQPGAHQAAAARVVFSAGVSEPLRQQLLRAGVFRVLAKPVALADLMNCTRQAVAWATAAGLATARNAQCTSPAPQPWDGAAATEMPNAAPNAAPNANPASLMATRSALTPAASPAAAAEIASAIAHFFGGDFKLYVDFDQRCRLQFSSDLKLGDQALGETNLPALHRLAHSLKSVLQSLGHGAVSEVAARLEVAADRAQLRECISLWQQLAGWLRAHATA